MPRRRVDDLEDLPAIKFDDEGFPIIPNPISPTRRLSLNDQERKVRFLVAYNVFAGNESRACLDAGVTPAIVKSWRKDDDKFCEKLLEQRDAIVDRVRDVLSARIGLIRPDSRYGKVTDSVLLALWQKLKPEDFGGEQSSNVVGSGITIKSEIPRPKRDDNAAV